MSNAATSAEPKRLRTYDDALQEQLRDRAEQSSQRYARGRHLADVRAAICRDGNVLHLRAVKLAVDLQKAPL